MNAISFKGAVVTKTGNDYSTRILQGYYFEQKGKGDNRNIPLDLNHRSVDRLNLVLWGQDCTKFSAFYDTHQEEIPAKPEDLDSKSVYLAPDSKRWIRLSKLAAALVDVLKIPKAETLDEVSRFIGNPNNLTNDVVTEDALEKALNMLKESNP